MQRLSRDKYTTVLDPALPPAMTITSGEELAVETWDAYKGVWGADQEPPEVGAATGPIAVEGAGHAGRLEVAASAELGEGGFEAGREDPCLAADFLDELPRTDTGKVRRSELPRLLERVSPVSGGGSITGFYTVLVEGDDTRRAQVPRRQVRQDRRAPDRAPGSPDLRAGKGWLNVPALRAG